MTSVGVAFILLGLLLSVSFAVRLRSTTYVALFFVHLVAAFFIWNFTLSRTSDSWGYYSGYYLSVPSERDFFVGTLAVCWLTVFIRDSLDASYVDMYMVFHLTGYLGIVAFYHICQQEFLKGSSPFRGPGALVHIAAFLPSVHVWTSVVGKDSLMFLGLMAFVWGALRPQTRLWSIICGVGLCFIIRPHVAGLLLGSCALAIVLEGRTPLVWRVLSFFAVVGGLLAAIPFIMEYVGLQSADPESFSSYIEGRQAVNLEGGSSVDISEYPFPLQFFTYMYRPMFFDANGGLALIVSVENLIYLCTSVLLGGAIWRAFRSGERGFFMKFNAIFWTLSTSLFAVTTANLGLAMRQKVAFLPSFFLFILSAHAMRKGALQREVVPEDLPDAASV